MEEIGLPCSVITSHGESASDSSELNSSELNSSASALPYISVASTEQHCNLEHDDNSSLTDVTVYEIVSVNVWPSSTTNEPVLPGPLAIEENDNLHRNEISDTLPRKRKSKRPYSPEIEVGSRKAVERRKVPRKQKIILQTEKVQNVSDVEPDGKPFSCDKCHSPFIVNPARSHRSNPKRKYRPRKIVDPTKKLLVLCNACGLSMAKSKKEKPKKVSPTQEDKDDYLKKSHDFAASLAVSLQDPDASILFCPAFKNVPCRCLQKYILGEDKHGERSEDRAIHLLALLKDARCLKKQKDVLQTNIENSMELGTKKSDAQKSSIPRGFQKRRSKAFEEFVFKNRQYLRKELHLCERASQKILLYSNNFLHKKLISSPNGGPRLERITGKNFQGLLKPISELPYDSCCNDKCVTLAQTHSKLLESWRATAKLGQREARRVLAEMLTPSGGAKANCYKFITMVTGCSYATICSVSDQMKRTQGEREPPEHGLKKWWREHPRDSAKDKRTSHKSNKNNSDEEDSTAIPDVSEIHIPSREELQTLCPQEANNHLLIQRDKLLELQKHISEQQAQLQEQQAQLQQQLKLAKLNSKVQQLPIGSDKTVPLPVLTTQAKGIETMAVLASADNDDNTDDLVTRTTAQQVLHILELPTTSPSVITSLTESVHPQPTISVMTPSGEFEPLNISNVVILPDSALDTSTISATGTAAEGTSVISYNSTLESSESLATVMSSSDQQSGSLTNTSEALSDVSKGSGTAAVNTFQLYNVMDPTTSNLLHFTY